MTKPNFFRRNRVLIVGIVGLSLIHLGWYRISRNPKFTGIEEKPAADIKPRYIKHKDVKEASA